jgi:hypothetical protein
MVGVTYGRLHVVTYSGEKVKATCECGVTKVYFANNLRRGITRSCGCLNKAEAASRETTHGMSHTSIYKTWRAMRDRCVNKNDGSYKNYGARGVRVCDRWMKSFDAFFADMGDRPPGKTLDRIDNNGDYTPGNVRWASKSEQARNRRTTHTVEWFGQTIPFLTAYEESGSRVPMGTVHTRLSRGWPIAKAMWQVSQGRQHV